MAAAAATVRTFHVTRSKPLRFAHVSTTLRCSIVEGPTIPSPRTSGYSETTVSSSLAVSAVSALPRRWPPITLESAPYVVVTEARDRVGGNFTTVERNGYLWEAGPNNFPPYDPIVTMVDSGLKDDLVLGDPNAHWFVLWDGKLRPVPAKPTDLPVFDLMSIGGKLRAGFGALGFRPAPSGHEESVEAFVRRNRGDEVFERLIEPFCSGVYAGHPSQFSMKAAFGKVWKLEQIGGSIIGGTVKTIQDKNKAPKPPRDP